MANIKISLVLTKLLLFIKVKAHQIYESAVLDNKNNSSIQISSTIVAL